MKMRYLICTVVGLSLLASVAGADVQVGDRPTLKFKDFQSKKEIDLADLKGKIVVVDFWATWCGPCMGEASHMVAVNQKYSDKGMQFIGVSLDQDPSALKSTIAEKKFTWPMMYEGQGWSDPTPKAWGVSGIPQTFIIGPDGDVLWRGHPANIDSAIEAAFKDHPPQLVDPKTLNQAKAILDQVDSALADQQSTKALKLLATVPDAAKADGDISGRVKSDTDKLQEFGNSELASIDPLIQSQQYAVAIQKLRDLSNAFAGTPVSSSAKTKLNELGSDPKVKAALENEKAEKAAADALAAAKQLKDQKKDDLAYPQFKTIVKGYPKTTAAAEAADIVKTYEADTNFMAAYNIKNNKKKAESLLLMADNYRQMGNSGKAREKYREVLDQFPNTTWATTAKNALAAMTDSQ